MNRLLFFLLLLLSMDVQAQTLNVTSYAAKGDAQQVWVTVTNGSPEVGFTNTLSAADIGKTIELFGCGLTNIGQNLPCAYNSLAITTTNYQDFIGIITNVVGNTAFIYSTDTVAITINGNNLVAGQSYNSSGQYVLNGINPGYVYNYTNGANDTGLQAFSGNLSTTGQFLSASNSVILIGTANDPITAKVVASPVYCVYGTNNVNAFANCIAAAGINETIYIPHGTISPWGTTNAYLLIPFQSFTNDSGLTFDGYDYLLTAFGVILNRGGFYFQGDGVGQSILEGQGAFKAQLAGGRYYRGMRSGIFGFSGPVTNNFPVTFGGLTFDGGLQTAVNSPYQGTQPTTPYDNRGWDNAHHAMARVFSVGSPTAEPGLALLVVTNCEFRHFRGEMIIDATGTSTIENDIITNDFFWDMGATALNPENQATIGWNIFTNGYQIAELYVITITNGPSVYENNYGSNLLHAGFVINGGSSTNLPVSVINNTFVGAGPNINLTGINNLVALQPACNVLISNNVFICSNNCTAIDINPPGSQGSFQSSNILITGNSFYNPFYIVGVYGSSYGPCCNITVSNNTLLDSSLWNGNFVCGDAFGTVSNCLWVDNAFNPPTSTSSKSGFVSGYASSAYWLVQTNTTYHYGIFHFFQVITDILSYANGPWYQTVYTTPGDAIVLKDFDGAQIPPGAQMVVDNTTNGDPNGGIYTIYLNSAMSRSIMTTNGQLNVFSWSNEWIQAGQTLPTSTTNYWPFIAKDPLKRRQLITYERGNNIYGTH